MRAERTSTTSVIVAGERGVALIAAMLIMMLMSALMIGFTTVVMSDQKYRGVDKDRARAFYGAQSGIEKLSTDLGLLFIRKARPTLADIDALKNAPPNIPSVTFVAPTGVTAYGAKNVYCLPLGDPGAIMQPDGTMVCNGTVSNGPYSGLMSLKKAYQLDAVARTAGGGEAHLIRKVEAVAIPVFQFGMFSDVDLSFFAGPDFNFGGRVHTNGNLFLAEGGGKTLTLTDKVTAVGEVIRKRMQNGVLITTPSTHDGTVSMATSTNTFRNLLDTEGSVTDSLPPASVRTPNSTWTTTSLTSYNGYIRNGGCQQPMPAGCSVPPTGTGAKPLNLDVVSKLINGHNTDLSWRPKQGEDISDSTLFGERLFGKVSLRILLSDIPADITNLPTVTALAPVRLGDDGLVAAGLTSNWAPNGAPNNLGAVAFIPVGNAYPAGVGVMTPISRSPGVQTITTTAATAANAAIINIAAPPAAGLGGPNSVFNLPGTLRFRVYDAALVYRFDILCTNVTATQFNTCTNPGGGNILAVPAGGIIRITDNGINFDYAVTAAVGAGTPRNYNVASTSTALANTFWMQSSAATQDWSVVTCTGITSTTPPPANLAVPGGPVLQFQGCTGVPATTVAANRITTGALVAQNVGTIGGYLKIEIQKADTSWQDVTMEVLNWGFSAPNQAGTICNDPSPNAIIRLQRLRDNAGACHYSSPVIANNSVNSYDYWPNTLFDPREGLLRDTVPATNNVTVNGVMHYVAIDVGNLAKWFACAAPYNVPGCTGTLALNNGGFGVYFSDRRNNNIDPNIVTNPLGTKTGEYGFEDLVNPLVDIGTPNGLLDLGEDVNASGTVDTFGQFPRFNDVQNALPPLPLVPVAPFDVANTVRPGTTFGRAAAMTSRPYLFRRALKLVNGGLPNLVSAGLTGLTFVTENPVYIQGDYNASQLGFVNPHAATSVIADAVTLLSNNWTDTNSFVNPYNPGARPRNVSWYRVAIIAGKGIGFPWPTAGNPPNDFGTDGGAHNFLRYLESGSTLNYRGSIATFYYNRQALGLYKCCATVYGPPTRVYNFDTDFLNPATLPPLTPVFRDINALGFSQEIRPGK